RAWGGVVGLVVVRRGERDSPVSPLRTGPGSALLLVLGEVVAAELALELLHAAGRVNVGLLAGEEGVRAGPDLDVHLGDGRADLHHDLAVVIDLAAVIVTGVDVLFHGRLVRWRGPGPRGRL